jgi:hypothetical protein
MKPKTIITAVLLLFVAISVVALISWLAYVPVRQQIVELLEDIYYI